MEIIREMKQADLDWVCKIEEQSFSIPWRRETFKQEIENDKAHYFVVEKNEVVVGYVGFWKIIDEAHIMNLAVAREERCQGIANWMMKSLREMMPDMAIRAMTLEVRAGNRAAISLYQKNGFRIEAVRPSYYQKPVEDACIMWSYLETDN